MDKFGPEATSLSAPKGAGSEVIAPVRDNTGSMLVNVLEAGINIFSNKSKQNQEKAEAEVRNKYTRELSAIEAGVRSGSIDATKASVMKSEMHSRYLSMYGDFREDFDNIAKSFSSNTAIGQAEKEVDDIRQSRRKLIDEANQLGYPIVAGSTKQDEDDILREVAKIKRAQKDTQDYRESIRFDEFVDEASRKRAEATEKEVSRNNIQSVGVSNLTILQKSAETLVKSVRAGQTSYENAVIQLNQMYGNMRSQVNAAAGKFPELAEIYGKIYDDTQKQALDLMNPAKRAEETAGVFKQWVDQRALMAIQKSRDLAMIAVGNRIGGQSMQNLVSTSDVNRNLAATGVLFDIDQPNSTPPNVVGTPNARNYGDTTLEVIREANTLPKERQDSVRKSGANMINGILTDLSDKATNPRMSLNEKDVNEVVRLISSPEFLQLRKEGLINDRALTSAQVAVERLYSGPVVSTVRSRLTDQARASFGDNKSVSSYVEIVPSSTGLTVVPKKFDISTVKGQSENTFAMRAMLDAKAAVQALDQIVKVEAHVRGTNDYKKVWEEVKGNLLPEIFPQASSGSETKKAPGSYKTEADVKVQVGSDENPARQSNAPADVAFRMISDIKAIQGEIKRARTPAIRALLEEELKSVTKGQDPEKFISQLEKEVGK